MNSVEVISLKMSQSTALEICDCRIARYWGEEPLIILDNDGTNSCTFLCLKYQPF